MNNNEHIENFGSSTISIACKGLMAGLLYGLLIYLSTIIIFPIIDAPVLWSVNAIPVAILLFNHDKSWPIILFFSAIGIFAGSSPEIWAGHFPATQDEIITSLILCGTNLLEIYLLAKIIRKITGPFPTRKKMNSLIITGMWAAAFVIIIMSVLSVMMFSIFVTENSFLSSVLRVFSSAFLGQVLLLSTIICWTVLKRPSFEKMSARWATELTLMLVTFILFIAVTLASLDSQTQIHYIFPYMTLPLLVCATFRFGIRIALTCAIISSLFTKYLASLGYIPFGSSAFSNYNQIIEMNIGLIALNVTILILAIIVADQKKAKQALSKREEWLEIAINHMSDGMYLLNRERRFKVCPDNLIDKFELPPEICRKGAHIKQVFKFRAKRGDYGPGDPDELVRKRLEELEEPETTQGHNTPSSGRTYEYFQNHTNDGEIIIIYHEITERLKAEKDIKEALLDAQQANKAKTDFLANMSHELRTPLNAIIGFSEIMSKGNIAETSADKVREYSNDIHMSGHHLLQIINDILDLSKIEAGMTEVELEQVHLGECIKECVTFLDIRATGAEIAISNEVENADTMIQADRRMFKQIMINLLSNSVKFTPRGGNINISHKINGGGECIISVADTGIGIAESEIEAMMEPFRQADSSLSKEFEGTGLGLPLVKSLMGLHNGEVIIKSAVGVGTTVLITFPQLD